MLILGAGGHAIEILDILEKGGVSDISFYDEIGDSLRLVDKYPILKDRERALRYLESNPYYCLGVGNPKLRKDFYLKFQHLGSFCSIVSESAQIGNYCQIGKGVNIMHFTLISNNAIVKDGVLLNAGSYVHHDSYIGEFSEIGPGVKVLGKARIGKQTFIGSNAVVLPGVIIGDNAVVGAGSVVTKNIPSGQKWAGVPAMIVR